MTKQKVSKKILIITTLVIAVLLTFIVLERTNTINLLGQSATTDSDAPTKQQTDAENKANADAKQEFIEDTAKAPDNSTGAAPQVVTLELTANQENNNSVTVFTKLYGVPSGSCKLTVTNNGNSPVQNADVIYQPEYSTCAGFSVPIATNGDWDIALSVVSGGQTYSKSITYQVK